MNLIKITAPYTTRLQVDIVPKQTTRPASEMKNMNIEIKQQIIEELKKQNKFTDALTFIRFWWVRGEITGSQFVQLITLL